MAIQILRLMRDVVQRRSDRSFATKRSLLQDIADATCAAVVLFAIAESPAATIRHANSSNSSIKEGTRTCCADPQANPQCFREFRVVDAQQRAVPAHEKAGISAHRTCLMGCNSRYGANF